MKTTEFQPMTESIINTLVGKKIEWTAEAHHGVYRGVAIIRSIDYSKHNPITCDCISGDDLKFAFLDNHGLTSKNGGQTYQATCDDFCFSYSDSYREIFFVICE